MTTDLDPKTIFALRCLQFVPPLIQKTLIEDRDFRNEYCLATDSVLSFGDSGLSIDRGELFGGVRQVLAGLSNREVIDISGRKWLVQNNAVRDDLPRLSISCGDLRFSLYEYFVALSPDTETRLRLLEKTASDVNLPESAYNRWRHILEKRPLEDEEVDGFQDDLDETPVTTIRSLRRIFNQGGRVNSSTLIPHSRRYYERLVGTYDGSTTIREYASGCAKDLFEQHAKWRPYDGFLISLFLSSHASLAHEINVDQLNNKDLVKAFGFLEKRSDSISQLGAVEVGLRILSKRPEIEPSLTALIEGIRDEDAEGDASGFRLLSALFCLVDGELSRIRLFSEEPPFYRRLASLSHASLVHRQLVNSYADIGYFIDWASENAGLFGMQSLVDMRLEPRWDPKLVAPSQLKAEFVGRIMTSAEKWKRVEKDCPVYQLVFGDSAGTLHSLGGYPHQWFPGPLEGIVREHQKMPSGVAEAIDTQLRADEVGPSSFAALINASMIFGLCKEYAGLAEDALKGSSYRLQGIESRSQLVAILDGLATVAAGSRSPSLADGLRILVRRYRNDFEFRLSIQEVVMICLSAAASRSDLAEWSEFVGEWLTELAFGDLTKEEVKELLIYLSRLCHSVPELWVTCGRADAALRAILPNEELPDR